ncbi:hypothetical protein BOTCAL_0175g00120 [Botryotinia calthae]|uniref:BTB domain-containing protein n=1 Tax=Botryotinia calthae TaxID=38488 RepID=A0A4Y8D0T5_9HELO|nr:hypothetical protein BOTCAL_0175g00120 [Botryotinia calthae]
MTTPSKKHWPKRPILDYSEDEFIRIKVGTEPNLKHFNVSKIRLAYHSPYFRTSLNFPREDSQVIELPDACPKIFRHIVQYMNTGSIVIPIYDRKNGKHLDLPTLTHIWFLAHYLLIPRVQNIAIARIFYRLDHGESEPVFKVDEMVTTLNIVCGTDGTVIADDNNVYSLLGSYMTWHSDYPHWTDEQKNKVPRKVLSLMAEVLRDYCVDTKTYRNSLSVNLGIGNLRCYYVDDKIDDEYVTLNLPDFVLQNDEKQEE